jgi:hypothetical protein
MSLPIFFEGNQRHMDAALVHGLKHEPELFKDAESTPALTLLRQWQRL